MTEGFPVINLAGIGDAKSGATNLRSISDTRGRLGPLFVAGALAGFDMTPANVGGRMVEHVGA